jgi:hypothetical protein
MEPRILMDTPDTWSGLRALLAGVQAAAIFPTREIPRELFGRFQILPLDLPQMTHRPALAHLAGRVQSKACRQVIELILRDDRPAAPRPDDDRLAETPHFGVSSISGRATSRSKPKQP